MSWLSDHTLLTGATVAAATMGGVFWGFSTFIMKALDEIPVPQGVAAMQSINKFAPTPLFMIPLFGTAVVGIGLAVNGLARLDDPASKYKLLGAGIYLVGIVLTAAYHVPKNDALAALDPSAAATVAFWRDYVTTWTAANHIRTLSCLGAAVSWGLALRS